MWTEVHPTHRSNRSARDWEMTMIPCQRDLFEMPDDIAYLNCAYMGPISRRARAAGEAGLARKTQPWRITARDFFSESEETRALFARLVGADADGVAIIPSASYGIAVAAANLPVAAGQRILTLADSSPRTSTPGAMWLNAAARRSSRFHVQTTTTGPPPYWRSWMSGRRWSPCPTLTGPMVGWWTWRALASGRGRSARRW